ncbi:alpha/beta hydrolase [Pontiellaceae bacterium B12227]|nr:alpha/beta hydrolase [Pontiellaceae bacterium B12227]
MIENPLIRYALYGGGIYLFLNLYALLISDRLLFRPQNPGYTHLPNEVRIPTSDGETLNAVYLNNPEAEYTLLFSHGNGEDLSVVLPFVEQFRDRGCSVFMYDYRGYGTSDGAPSYRKVKDDAEAVYRWLTEEQGVAPEKIIAQGRSLGGALATRIAAHHPVGGLILECSFASALRVKTGISLLPWDKFNSEKLMTQVNCPVLVIHGENDHVVPFSHGKKLYAAAPDPKRFLWIEDARHMDYAYVAEERYFDIISDFIGDISSYQSTSAE